MGYRIEYDTGNQKYEVHQVAAWRFPLMAAGAFIGFLLLTWAFWPEGAELIREAMIPGDNAQTVQALQGMAEELRGGASIRDAVTAFCREIIAGAQGSY